VGEKKIDTRFDRAFNDLHDAYQALGEVILEESGSDVSYEMGYLDAFADAVHMLGWAVEGKPLKAKDAFCCFATKRVAKLARQALRRRRAGKP
jgi:hypothetical protein